MTLSVLMSVYRKESPEFLRQSLSSLVTQTVQADEVVIVKDGPLGDELDTAIGSFCWSLPIVTRQLPHNVGLGLALREGVQTCKGEVVARMDSDDICLPDRFKKQLSFLQAHDDVDVVGGAIAEFESDPGSVAAVRRLPSMERPLAKLARFRNPLNHMTVMFRKQSVLAAGNYQPCLGFEDYELWARMLMKGARLHNLSDVLVLVRCGNGMQLRRGGLRYLKQEIHLQSRLEKMGFLSKPQFLFNLIARAPVRMVPPRVRSLFYHALLRQAPKPAVNLENRPQKSISTIPTYVESQLEGKTPK